jgi:anti-sigma B factor antagonist
MAANDLNGSARSGRRVTPGASNRFVAATEHLETGEPVVSVMGEVDLATAPALEQTLLAVAKDRAGQVIVDLSGCSFLDSSGLRALLATREGREHSTGQPAVVLSNPNLMKVFQITRFDDLFEIYPTLTAAANRNGNGNGNALQTSRQCANDGGPADGCRNARLGEPSPQAS